MDEMMERVEAEIRRRQRTLVSFAHELGVQSQHVNNWKKRGIPGARLLQVAQALGWNLEYLVSGRGNPLETKTKEVPIIDWMLAGRAANASADAVESRQWIPCPTECSDNTFALLVDGNTMDAPNGRSYPQGSVIFIDPTQAGATTSGDRVLATIGGSDQILFRELVIDGYRRYLRALNPAYLPVTEGFSIIGKVLGMWLDG